MRDEGKTILFVTHDMGSMVRFCHRAILLERGRMLQIGDPPADRGSLPRAQLRPPSAQADAEDAAEPAVARDRPASWRSGSRTPPVSVLSAARRRVTASRLRARVRFKRRRRGSRRERLHPQRRAQGGHDRRRPESQIERTGRFDAGEEALFSFGFENVLAPGRYSPLVNLARRGTGLDVIDRFDSGFSFVVTATRAYAGCDLPVDVSVEHANAADRVSV